MDWNNDGSLDILSGCYRTEGTDGGHLQILAGNGDMDFANAESVKNVAGNPLQNVEVIEDGSNQIEAICIEQHAVDYDGDGDLDIVMGCFGKTFYLYENISDSKGENKIAEKPTVLPIESPSYHSAPHLVDWDNDGDLDLLTGGTDGGAVISENTGTREKPEWAAFKQLIDPSTLQEQMGNDPVKMAPSTRIWATDFNRDGLLDLLVGDSTSIVTPAEGVSESEWQAHRDADKKEMAEISARQQELMPKYQEAVNDGGEPPEELAEQMKEIRGEMKKIYNGRSKYENSKRTGHVWVLIRKPDPQAVNAKAPKNSSLSQTN